MKLFISWSGEFSQRVAEKLSIWIPTIIQSVEVFYSPDDIAKGENWSNRLSEELDDCSFGIICLTPENVAAPWVHFEAGALSKSLNARVSAIMLNISPSDVKGPLAHYQNTAFERKDFFRLFQSINKSSETPLKPEILRNAFENAWDKMKAEIENIIKTHARPPETAPTKDNITSDSDALQEILRLVRKADITQSQSFQRVSANDIPRNTYITFEPGDVSPEMIMVLIQDYVDDKETTYDYIRKCTATGERIRCRLKISSDEMSKLSNSLNTIGTSAVRISRREF